MDDLDQEIEEKFAAFEKEQDPTRVLEALELIEGAERSVVTWDAATLEKAFTRRLRFSDALDRYIDPSWDADNLPVKGTTPPPTQGIVYGSGEVDPETIDDPEVRAHYVQALKASKDYAKWYDVQFQLRRIDERGMRFLELLLSERSAGAQTNRQIFEEMLAASAMSQTRKERLQALLPK